MTQKASSLRKSDLAQFTGTETWYRHALMRSILFTEGAKYVADKAGAYWLLDEIAIAQVESSVSAEPFQVWKLQVRTNQTATLTCEDGNYNVILTKEVSFTDFPLDEITFFFTDKVILLPSEY